MANYIFAKNMYSPTVKRTRSLLTTDLIDLNNLTDLTPTLYSGLLHRTPSSAVSMIDQNDLIYYYGSQGGSESRTCHDYVAGGNANFASCGLSGCECDISDLQFQFYNPYTQSYVACHMVENGDDNYGRECHWEDGAGNQVSESLGEIGSTHQYDIYRFEYAVAHNAVVYNFDTGNYDSALVLFIRRTIKNVTSGSSTEYYLKRYSQGEDNHMMPYPYDPDLRNSTYMFQPCGLIRIANTFSNVVDPIQITHGLNSYTNYTVT